MDIMNDWIEIEGRNKDEALERACNALNTTISYLDYELVNPSGSKIRARKSEAPKAEVTPAPTSFPKIVFKKPVLKSSEPADKPTESEVPSDRPVTKISIKPVKIEKQIAYLAEATEVGQKAKEILQTILSHIEETALVSLQETEEDILLEIKSNGSGLFIGKHGQTLESFQHVVAKMLGLDRNSSRRLILDSEGYRSRREDSLQGLAHRVAHMVGKNRRSQTLEPMGAMDRRVIHLALAEHPYVSTKSIGEGSERKIIVAPKGGHSNARRSGNEGGQRSPRGNSQGGERERNSGPRSRPSAEGNRSNGNQGGGRARLVTSRSRLHDSYDVPAAPNMAIFPEDIDELMDLPEDQMNERVSLMRSGSGEE